MELLLLLKLVLLELGDGVVGSEGGELMDRWGDGLHLLLLLLLAGLESGNEVGERRLDGGNLGLEVLDPSGEKKKR